MVPDLLLNLPASIHMRTKKSPLKFYSDLLFFPSVNKYKPTQPPGFAATTKRRKNQSPKDHMEALSVGIESLNASSSSVDKSIRELEPCQGSDNQEAEQEEESEISERMKPAHEKESDGEEAHEEDDHPASVYPEIAQVLDPTWMASVKEKLLLEPRIIKVSSSNVSTSIHRVPDVLFQQDKNAYVPHVISIGPLHYNERGGRLQAMEEHKWRYLNEIVSINGEAWFERCMVTVKLLENNARECYSQVIMPDINSFVEMMVLDGCFIILLFYKNFFEQFEDDPLFELALLNRELVIDLVMLENQIPYFILQTIFDLIFGSSPPHPLKALALEFFYGWPFFSNITNGRIDSSEIHIHHLLHLLHENIILTMEKKYRPENATDSIQCASKLKESGIKFKRRDLEQGAGNLLDIKFEKGVIEIPLLYVEDKTNTILRNFIAFEQSYPHCKKFITTYTCFMDDLINSSKDVEILLQNGIIKNYLGSEEDVALLFNNISNGVLRFGKSYYLSGVCREIKHYCGTGWPKLRATLMHDYFKNPWAIISFTAAVLLLLFTLSQAFFSAFPKFAIGN